MKKLYLLSIALIALLAGSVANMYAQGVAINANGSHPDSSAIIDVSSISQGALMPRMSTTQRNAIHNPASGLFIYNTDCNVVNYNAGTPASPSWATMNASNVLVAGVSITASPAGAICTGTSVTFSATPSQNNLSPSYQWQVNGSNVGGNSDTYTTSSLNNGDVVTCILTSSVNCVTGSPATSNVITVLVSTAPTITGTTPASFCSGSSVTLGASASSGIINWYSVSTNGASLSTGASFTTSGLTSTTTYYVDATSNGCTSASRTAVTATYYPNTPAQPGAITGPSIGSRDSSATYSINPVANAASYFWTVTIGVITSGQGTTSINVSWPDTIGAGTVSVVASSPCGTSAPQSTPVHIGTLTFSATSSGRNGSIQTFTVPNTNTTTYTIKAYGAQGAYYCSTSYPGGQGAGMQGDFSLPAGTILNILVGQVAPAGGGGGGGGTFVVQAADNTPLIIAAGGGGGGCNGPGAAGNSGTGGSDGTDGARGTGGNNGGGGGAGGGYGGGGGGGFCGDGGNTGSNYCSGGAGGNGCVNGGDMGCGGICANTKGLSYANGATGGSAQCYPSVGDGGFGGGGAAIHGNACGGGGGGYSGGGGGGESSFHGAGGGGGSYNSGTNQTNSSGIQTGDGLVIISW